MWMILWGTVSMGLVVLFLTSAAAAKINSLGPTIITWQPFAIAAGSMLLYFGITYSQL